MEIWVLEYNYFSDYTTTVKLFATEKDALAQALKEAKRHISNEWDLNDEDISAEFDKIAEFENNGMLRQALETFNDFEGDQDDSKVWLVYSKTVSGVEDSTPKLAYKATTSGATCRGQCKNYNEYAYADRPDGTYVCHQCSTFCRILGISP
jgi:hypothetical protein